MAEVIYYVFLITKGLTGREKLQQVFLEKDISRAKLYFEAYILENENPNDYKLYRIAELDNRKRVKENYSFITGGYEIKAIKENKRQILTQMKLDIEKELNIEKNKTNAEIIKELFDGKFIDE